ncbi:MAG: hypothetical protein ACFFAH_01355 [Promethearchaeota archaeon]
MRKCKECGKPISDEQYNNFKGLCAGCVEISNLSRGIVSKRPRSQGNPYFYLGIFILIFGLIVFPITFFAFPVYPQQSLMIGGLIASMVFSGVIGFLILYGGYKKNKKSKQ